jgi:LacI family repressor for deo operon, udp, cdd, tsx, nupC, and nupG
VSAVTVRLADIAERAGVSVSTVSRVLNDRPGINAKTRRQVLTAVDVLGYDRPARLRPRVSGLVGLIVPELENPFFPRLATQIEAALHHHGYTPVLCTQSLGGIHEDDYVAVLLEHGVSGIIFVSGVHAMPSADPQRYHRLVSTGLPIVLINGYLPDLPAAFLANDDRATSELGVAHLANMGHTRIGIALGQARYTPVIRKAEGFREAMRRHVDPGLDDASLAELTSYTTFTVDGGAQAAEELLDRGVTGILCASDVMALGAIRAVRQRGLRVPEDVSVVGSDDSSLNEFTDPPLTTVRQASAAMAGEACRVLLELINGVAAPRNEMLFRPELVVRSSTARAPVVTAGSD